MLQAIRAKPLAVVSVACSAQTVPLVMKKLGADPAMASSIVVTTFTDVAACSFFLGSLLC
jgi:magnesium transporter